MVHKHLRISARELRVSKINKTLRPKPCAKEFQAFLTALELYGDGNIPLGITTELTNCMEVKVCSSRDDDRK